MDPPFIQVMVDVPAEVAGHADPSALAQEARLLLVLERFRRGDLSSARAAHLLGLGRVGFLELCAEHGTDALRYDSDDFRRELAEIRTLGH